MEGGEAWRGVELLRAFLHNSEDNTRGRGGYPQNMVRYKFFPVLDRNQHCTRALVTGLEITFLRSLYYTYKEFIWGGEDNTAITIRMECPFLDGELDRDGALRVLSRARTILPHAESAYVTQHGRARPAALGV